MRKKPEARGPYLLVKTNITTVETTNGRFRGFRLILSHQTMSISNSASVFRVFRGKHVRIIFNNAFWYLGGNGGWLCSYRKVGSMPKYQIMQMIDGGAVLEILPDDHSAETEHFFFDPTEDANAIKQAMQFAEQHAADHSTS